ncbi:hypothetical protein RND81_01G221900 [Saponaria officinalis]|uniref:Uncharacterized protein n=1 Tax=Saponaria officinalis TaxID=3572 RepID=A0AAW1NI08_SAPOF
MFIVNIHKGCLQQFLLYIPLSADFLGFLMLGHLKLSSSILVNDFALNMQQYNTQLLINMVRQQFKCHMHETDPEKIQQLKDGAARGLINHMLYESEKLSGRKFSQNS